MTQSPWLLVVLIVLILVNGCGRPAPQARIVVCADPVSGCRFALDERAYALRFSESPRAMRPFVVEVEASGATTVGADFAMSGMDMVPNRYHLRRESDGYWRANVVLPVCVSGREDWVLTLVIDDGKVAVPFSAGR